MISILYSIALISSLVLSIPVGIIFLRELRKYLIGRAEWKELEKQSEIKSKN